MDVHLHQISEVPERAQNKVWQAPTARGSKTDLEILNDRSTGKYRTERNRIVNEKYDAYLWQANI
ncbi:hypothetical protein PITCH_A2080005 [uncultured Desulfobacterium sp.]|uniref:Uncharacterized protein n=1 Tax=uncultured Desulfobacterium sp. TaxID=201089 RepID=A0A445MXE4_9BACT|nr:hypothetical protein PITCH_A2080005 [uncultured Desulfobacterium sp.]